MADKRIIELANEKLVLADGDMTIVDSESGTYKYDLNRLAVKTITDTTLSVECKPADAKAVGDQIADVKRDLSEATANILDIKNFDVPDVTVEDNVISASAAVFNSRFGMNSAGIALSCEEGERYVISGKARTDANGGTTGNGLRFTLTNSDDTAASYQYPNSTTSWTPFSVVTDKNKTVTKLNINYSSQGTNKWYVKDLQIQKGTIATDYVPDITAVDYIARDLIYTGKRMQCAFLGYASYLGNAIPIIFSDGTVFMIDSFISGAWSSLNADLIAMGIKHIDYFMLTHWHEDHCGNIQNLITHGYIDDSTTVFLPQALDTSASGSLPSDWSAVVANESNITTALTTAGVTIVRPSENDTVVINECEFRFWNTDHSGFYPDGAYHSLNYNDWSLCADLTCGNTRICFTGDIGPIGQQKMVDLGTMRKSNIMTSPHHGWTNGSYANGYGLVPAFINAVSPDAVMTEDFSAHANYIDTIKSPIQTWCQKNGIPHYRTYINGSMHMRVGTDGWSMLGAYVSYITNGSDWNWYDFDREMMLDAKIKFFAKNAEKDYYAHTSTAGILRAAYQQITGSDDTKTYDFRIRIIDSDNQDSFFEGILSGLKYKTTSPSITPIRQKTLAITAANNQGTIAVSGLVGTPYIVVQVLDVRS